jgi:xanthine dehydrogenase YagR molybdenum-binding subunit
MREGHSAATWHTMHHHQHDARSDDAREAAAIGTALLGAGVHEDHAHDRHAGHSAAMFAEVRVDEGLGLVRLNRFVGAYDAGRIINPRTARSQAIGGIIWGIGEALLEQSETDQRMAHFLHQYYSGYLVPANADIPELDVVFVGEFDPEASLLGAKGLGELTAVSVAPAIVNAVYHATGKRIRDLPVTVEKLL